MSGGTGTAIPALIGRFPRLPSRTRMFVGRGLRPAIRRLSHEKGPPGNSPSGPRSLTCRGEPNPGSPRPAMPAVPTTSLGLPTHGTQGLAMPADPCHAAPRRDTPCHACRSTPREAEPIPVARCDAQLSPACLSGPGHAVPSLAYPAKPCLPIHAEPCRDRPRSAQPYHARNF